MNQRPPVHQPGWMVHWWDSLFCRKVVGRLTLFFPRPEPSFVFFHFETFPPTHLLSPTYPPLSPTYLLTYTLKMCYSHPHHVLTHPSIYLPAHPFTFVRTSPLGKYLPDPTYMAAPPYLVATPTDIAIVKNNEETNKMKVLHGACTCSLNQI